MNQTVLLSTLPKNIIQVIFIAIFSLVIGACAITPEMPDELRKPIEATDCFRDPCIDFIYLHGSRPAKTGATKKEKKAFKEQIEVLHNWISAKLYATPEAQQGLLKNNELHINPKPVRFYWGNMSETEFQVVQEMLHWSSIGKGAPGWLTRIVQKLFITGLHDTYWVGKYKNTRTVNLAMHDVVTQSIDNGRKVILFGHSAGGMAVQNYVAYHWPVVDMQELREVSKNTEVRNALKNIALKTCVRAILESGTMEIAADGRLIPRLGNETMSDMEEFRRFRQALWKEKIESLPQYSEKYCVPKGSVLGIVTYGNPAPVLEASITDDYGSISLLALRYLLENNLFWLNINHINDPLGYSIYDGHDLPQRVAALLGQKVKPGGGFFVSGTDDTSVSVAIAHSWYWLYPKKFASALARIFAEGYQKRIDPSE